MQEIKRDKIKTYEEVTGKLFIENVTKSDTGGLTVFTSNSKPIRLAPNQSAWTLVHNQLKDQNAYQKEYLLDYLRKEQKRNLALGSTTGLIGLGALATQVSGLFKPTPTGYIISISSLITSYIIFHHEMILGTKQDIDEIRKYDLFFNKENELNHYVRTNPASIEGLSNKTQENLTNRYNKQPISFLNMDDLSYKELCTIRDNIKQIQRSEEVSKQLRKK